MSLPTDPLPPYTLAPDAIGPDSARRLLSSRRMDATRTLLQARRDEALAYLAGWRPGLPDERAAVLATLDATGAALAEVEAAERGCGAGEGECVCPCLVGIRAPHESTGDPAVDPTSEPNLVGQSVEEAQ